jgi:hypothetical protein
MERTYLFVNGPWNGKRAITDGRPIMRIPIPIEPSLESMLQASVKVLENGMAEMPEPSLQVAHYALLTYAFPNESKIIPFDRRAYQFMGWE